MKKFFKWLLIILLAILTCPIWVVLGAFLIALIELLAALVVATAPVWIPIAAIGLVAAMFID